ncbi:hypothetical protein JCGZ_14247 [Jatropha curcas]|uniref:Uncharacterized protein n=1 Tax=Jatropha curcas TaxID=180498 RepID=A0A067JWX7_JATCU|nr:uncharacterized protein LOC105643332 [Jatropha curcas]KDP28476.1 hypothetical protein JCGZ_14247 [Jatropha curcas]
MRIRKNRKLSYGGVGEAEVQQPHVCLLNQSPWDAISFSQQNYQSAIHQFERENSFDGNEDFRDSVRAVERENESARKTNNNDTEMNPTEKKDKLFDDNEIDREFKFSGSEENEHKAVACITNNSSNTDSSTKKSERRGQPREAKRARSASSSRHEFYYYSGFGPLWAKKKDRGEGNNSKGFDISWCCT